MADVYADGLGQLAVAGLGAASAGVAPLAPVLVSPANNSTSDLTDTTFTWQFQSLSGLSQGAFSIRFMQPSSGVWMYWTGSGLSTIETWISSSSQSVTITSGLSNGALYAWQVAAQDTNGVSSPWSQSSFVTGSPVPSVTVTGPTGTQTVGSVTLTWVNSDVVQVTFWQVIVYTAAQVAAEGFSPGSAPWVWNSGLTAGAASSCPLPNLGTGTYYAYVQITNQYNETSAWADLELVFSYTTPEQPTLTASLQSNNTVVLTVVGHDTGGLVGHTEATVYRSLDGGNTWAAVSSFTDVSLPSSDQTASETDPTPWASQVEGPYETTYYYAVVIGPDGILSPRSTTVGVTEPTFSGSQGWTFLDNTTGSFTVQPMVTNFSQAQPVRAGYHEIIGNPYPVRVLDVVGSRKLKIEITTLAVDDWQAVLTMLQSGYQLYITNVYGLVGIFDLDPEGYDSQQQPGSTAATIRLTTFSVTEVAVVSTTGSGT